MRKIKNKYKRPKVTWNTLQIKENKELRDRYGLRRQKEILISRELLRRFRGRARILNATRNKEQEKILVERLVKFGLLKQGSALDDVLALTVDDILSRRLQTIVFSRGLASTIKQARQLVVHGHVSISGRKATNPSYIVPVEEENKMDVKKFEIGKAPPAPVHAKSAAVASEGGESAEDVIEGDENV